MCARLFITALLAFSAAPVFAAGTAQIAALTPANTTVGVGTPITFTVLTSGFGRPTFSIVDSFPGGVNSTYIDGAGNFYWVPNVSYVGAHTLSITVTDADAPENTATLSQGFSIVLPSVSVSAPSPAATVLYGTPVSFTVSSVGFRGAYYQVADSFSGSTVRSGNLSSSGVFYWTPSYQDIGTHTLIVSARDLSGNYATTSQTIVVEDYAHVSASVISPGTTVGAGQTLTLSFSASGFSNPAFSVIDAFYPVSASSTLAVEGSKATWTPTYQDVGVHRLQVSASDASGRSASTKLSITVVPQQASVPAVPAPMPYLPPAASTSTPALGGAPGGKFLFNNLLAFGMSGAEVTALQNKLTALGFYSGPITGYFGPLTRAAVKALQKANGLETPGHVGPGTRALLNK